LDCGSLPSCSGRRKPFTFQRPASPGLLHVDGKVVRNADPAPPRNADSTTTVPSPLDAEIPPELQKPKADKALTLVNVMTTDQRLVEQIALGSGH